jgi:tetratricopeptide (TPR) repeat protein
MEDYEMAEKHYTEALILDPTYSTAYNNLGVVYLKRGQYDVSKRYFEKALEYNSHNVKAVYNLGVTHFREGNYLRAFRYYLASKRMDAEYVQERGDRGKMEKEVNEALKKDPESLLLRKVSSRLNNDDIKK